MACADVVHDIALPHPGDNKDIAGWGALQEAEKRLHMQIYAALLQLLLSPLKEGREEGAVSLLHLTLLKLLVRNAHHLGIFPLHRLADGGNGSCEAAILEELTEVTCKIVLSASSPAAQ